MFGISAFAQSPFAALGDAGTKYSASRSESFTLTAMAAAALGAIVEVIELTDSQTSFLTFNGVQIEAFTLSDIVDGVSITMGTVEERMALSDIVSAHGWFVIINDQTPGWTDINDNQ